MLRLDAVHRLFFLLDSRASLKCSHADARHCCLCSGKLDSSNRYEKKQIILSVYAMFFYSVALCSRCDWCDCCAWCACCACLRTVCIVHVFFEFEVFSITIWSSTRTMLVALYADFSCTCIIYNQVVLLHDHHLDLEQLVTHCNGEGEKKREGERARTTQKFVRKLFRSKNYSMC